MPRLMTNIRQTPLVNSNAATQLRALWECAARTKIKTASWWPAMSVTIAIGLTGVFARAAIPSTARFELSAASAPLFESKRLYEQRHVLQSFAFDDAGGYVYVLQVEGTNADGTFAEHSARGDLVLTKLSIDGETIAGHMVLRGFGHGVAMAVERENAAVYLWTEVDSAPNPGGSGRGTKLGRFRFANGVTLDASSSALRKFAPIAGARVCTPSIDATRGRFAMRYVSAKGKWHVALFDLAKLKTGHTKPVTDIPLPFAFGVVQGWCTYGSYIYVYAGEAYSDANPPPGNATLWCIDWNTGAVIETRRTNAFGDLTYREPEGLAVQFVNGVPRLCFGFGAAVAAGDPRRRVSIAYIDQFRGSGGRPDRHITGMAVGTTTATSEETSELQQGFIAPPDAAKPVVFWWWFNSHVSKGGITRDLEEFRAKGLGGVVLINSTTGFGTGPIPKGPEFLSKEWRELYRHALSEANRLGLDVGVNLSTGWCMGGPWIKPENSGRWFLQSSVAVSGPTKFSGVLPLPGNRDGYDNAGQLFVKNYVNLPLAQLDYRDSAIIAFPEPKEPDVRSPDERRKLLAAKSTRREQPRARTRDHGSAIDSVDIIAE